MPPASRSFEIHNHSRPRAADADSAIAHNGQGLENGICCAGLAAIADRHRMNNNARRTAAGSADRAIGCTDEARKCCGSAALRKYEDAKRFTLKPRKDTIPDALDRKWPQRWRTIARLYLWDGNDKRRVT